MNCQICNNNAPVLFTKLNVVYHQCNSCKMVFSDYIPQDGMVGGEHEVGRNEKQNTERIARIDEMVFGAKKEDVWIADWGCGHGMLVSDLKKYGYPNVVGYDPYNEEFSRLPEKNKFHVVTMVECAEHLSSPFIEFDAINRCLRPGGAILIETSFVNIAWEEKIPLEDFFYIAPQNGHCTIHSHHSLDLLMVMKGFSPRIHFNRHVRLYVKPIK